MKLVLAEKPSVAMSLSKVIGADQRGDGYMEGNGYLVSWCVGHLVELSPPEVYDEKYAKWKYDDLPILPEHWQYQVSASTKKQFGILKKLMQRKDVESLICATDAGREGELIFRLVYHQCGCKKPVERLWISSMEDSAIREGFQKLRPGSEYDALYEAALCRERADWIVGINATRLFSCLYGQTLNVGRVMTPTLAMVVMRDAAIRAFKPEPFYSAELKFRDFQVGGERMKAKADAEKLVAECCQAGSAIITKVEQKEKAEKPPTLFDLTSLQREANRQLGFTAQQTLDYTQALYEKKLVTYPRTDSRYLTDDMAPLVPELVSVIQQSFQIQPDVPAPVNAAQVINSKKVTDHHAIIPTKTAASYDISSLPSGEQAILTMLAVRLICAVGTPCRYAETIVEAECTGQKFRTKGKTVTDIGWRRYAGKSREDAEKNAEAGELPELVSVIQQSFQIQPDAPAPVNTAQVINSKKVIDHHAIIPTKTAAGYDISSLPSGEQAILTMLAVRLICAVGTPCRYAETIVEAECAGQKFRTKGKTVTDMGWRRYAGKAVEDAEKNAEAGELPILSEGMTLELAGVDLKEGKTSPPKRFTDVIFCERKEWIGIEERSSA